MIVIMIVIKLSKIDSLALFKFHYFIHSICLLID